MKCSYCIITLTLAIDHQNCLALQQRCALPHGRRSNASLEFSFSTKSIIYRNVASTLLAHRERRTAESSRDNVLHRKETTKLISAEEMARQRRTGQAKRRIEKAARRENRIAQLEELGINALNDDERSELDGLLRARENFEEQYNPQSFSAQHVEFKRLHNEAFVALARFCQRDRIRQNGADADNIKDPNIFYLDGPDAGTSSALIKTHGFDPSCCYVANRHLSTCKILQQWLPEGNILHMTAAEALTPITERNAESFSKVDFAAYYFDGCGGFTPHIISMLSAALLRPEEMVSPAKTTAIGFSLMGGNKDVVEKEMDINRALTSIARTKGMRTRHVLDDPWRYGIPVEVAKTDGGTFTSWMLLETE